MRTNWGQGSRADETIHALAAQGNSGVTSVLYMCAIMRRSKSLLPRVRARGTHIASSPASGAQLGVLASAAQGRLPASATIASTYASRSLASRLAGAIAARSNSAALASFFHGCCFRPPPPPRRATLSHGLNVTAEEVSLYTGKEEEL
jgi:hypothetical protein